MSVREKLPTLDLGACCTPIRGDVPTDDAAEQLAAAFKALGDPARLRVLGLLATSPDGEVCACDLVGPLGKSQPTVSHHLKILREAGLVTAEKRGTNIWYAVLPAQLEALRAALGNPG